MNDCYFEKKDWRLCKAEVRICSDLAMAACITWELDDENSVLTTLCEMQLENFKRCWKQQQNDKRTEMKDA
jgi:cytochrome c oxidase assembly factor 4